ncbi:folylpolyglutamate synthase/dihydrofolate synthase family protein [Lysinibacillus sp. SGAir0095]|uniref:bifunctional folylpolyglutamate synthase/dihydrofolate synthase n=1 Tax=Lysinibacillus sp. SGAir0095 TaxID=2070463 RepID=UPI0010CCDC1B|nr:folylpolyglutamate synthase/dihydrofolate synthase family protein [Lysinibacillus sp. SGAir0095]QCR33034.1 bifunctional folylpolyglutamate synthase/dihydrofolate synthase [Lysinibacillus sp. SGAir0095]
MIPRLDDYKKKWAVESDVSIKPGLGAMKEALQLLQNPEKNCSFVHVAGTNGKGSTIAFLEQLARKHGLIVGKFMSPCIVDVHDQLQINRNPISEQEMDGLFIQLKEAGLSGKLTDFELLTCAAFLYFSQQEVDLVLLETGMGGREDSTNVITPVVSVITSIALEHTKFLGPTIQSIAKHKAGIIKQDIPVVVGRLPIDAYTVIENEVYDKQADLISLGNQFEVSIENTYDLYTNDEKGLVINNLSRILPGSHQADNMAIAITAFFEIAEYFKLEIDVDKIRNAVLAASLPGRFEEVLPNVYFDGAHNPASAEKLVQTIKQQFPDERIRFVVGVLADKDVKSVLQQLEQVSDEFYFVDFENKRAMTSKEMLALSTASQATVLKDYTAFLKTASSKSGKTFVTGSLYLLTEMRERLLLK